MDPYQFTARYYDGPNRLEIYGDSDPVSLQNRNGNKQLMMASLAKAVEESTKFIFLQDVKVSITWFATPEERYSTHLVADLDNIVKPILDAITGPKGVMVDDNQVWALDVGWQDPGFIGIKVQITVTPHIDDRMPKDALMFVHFPGRGCWPVVSEDHARLVVPALMSRFEAANKLISMGMSVAEIAPMTDPIQRFYPTARLGGFVVREASEFLC